MEKINNLKVKFRNNVNEYVKLACLEFTNWLELSFEFPIALEVYITEFKKVVTKDKREGCALFSASKGFRDKGIIRISTGDYWSMKDASGIYNSLMSILHSYAHEFVHYNQWVRGEKLKELDVDKTASELVYDYSEYKCDLLTAKQYVVELVKKGDMLFEKGDCLNAIEYYNEAIKISPESYEVYVKKGELLEKLEKYEEALNCYDQAISINPKDDEIYNTKGYLLDYLKKYADAINCYDIGISINSRNETILVNKGFSLMQLKDYKEALKNFNKAIKLNPEDLDILIFKAQVLEKMLKYKEALSCYNQVYEQDQSNELAIEGRNYLINLMEKSCEK